ncbi:unnamed protein product [Brassicogethes aeneus]|uniref:Uncharacterized protein n=1 Tax=Brassicogethes aeneus TaxID=1431903 RepID=A0A9P0FPF8_BRAAE|nr:unnamed protein product [Brassicogethes aeneus]
MKGKEITKEHNYKRVILYTDCKGLVEGKDKIKPKEKLDWHIRREVSNLNRKGTEIEIRWTQRSNTNMKLAHRKAQDKAQEENITWERIQYEGTSRKQRRETRKEKVRDKWQKYWDETDKGRTTHKHCRGVGYQQIELTSEAVQLITGHGNFKKYINRFKLKEAAEGTCNCDMEVDQTNEHIMYECPNETPSQARNDIITKYGDNIIMIREIREQANMNQIQKLIEWAEMVVEDLEDRYKNGLPANF